MPSATNRHRVPSDQYHFGEVRDWLGYLTRFQIGRSNKHGAQA
jgi:hypothetical protein